MATAARWRVAWAVVVRAGVQGVAEAVEEEAVVTLGQAVAVVTSGSLVDGIISRRTITGQDRSVEDEEAVGEGITTRTRTDTTAREWEEALSVVRWV